MDGTCFKALSFCNSFNSYEYVSLIFPLELCTRISTYRLGESAIMDIPAESSKLHDQDHLSTSDIDLSINGSELTVHVGVQHVTHKENKSNPWHIRSRNSASDEVGTSRRDEQSADPAP